MHAHAHADGSEESDRIGWFLEAHFGEVEREGPVLIVRVDEEEARVDLTSSVCGQARRVHVLMGDRR